MATGVVPVSGTVYAWYNDNLTSLITQASGQIDAFNRLADLIENEISSQTAASQQSESEQAYKEAWANVPNVTQVLDALSTEKSSNLATVVTAVVGAVGLGAMLLLVSKKSR